MIVYKIINFAYVLSFGKFIPILEMERSTINLYYIVTAPKVFAFAFSLVKKFMDEYTLSKIQIYKSDPLKWQAAILKLIPKDQLPAHFGGTLTDPDGNPKYTSKVLNKFL